MAILAKAEYENMVWEDLKTIAKGRGIATGRRSRADVVRDCVAADKLIGPAPFVAEVEAGES